MRLSLTLAAVALACALPGAASAQSEPSAIVSIYRIANGQQVNFLKWLARQEQISAAAGLPKSQLYVHTDGDSWDYMGINPVTTDAQDAAMDAAAKKMGLPSGPGVALNLRQHISSHTDTFTIGPVSAAQALAAYGQ